jgi:hypothetical protein
MSLLTIVIVLIIVGLLLWVIETRIPMDATIKKILIAVVVIVTVVWLCQELGVWHYLKEVHTPNLKS